MVHGFKSEEISVETLKPSGRPPPIRTGKWARSAPSHPKGKIA
jgi:hypothetical protein